MWRLVIWFCLTLVGCRFVVDGVYLEEPPGVGGGGPEPSEDGGARPADLARPVGRPDFAEPDPCGVSGPAIAGAATASCAADAPPVVDGDLADWSGVSFVSLSRASAAFAKGSFTGTPEVDDANTSGSFAVRWDASHLYVAARVNDDVRGVFPSSPNAGQDYSLHVFLDGRHDRVEGAYGPDDHQLIVTADGRGQDAQYGQQPHALPAGVKTAVGKGAGAGYTVELAVPWNVLGDAGGHGGRSLGFNVAISDNDSTSFQAQARYLVWKFVMPSGGCTTSPSCNTQIFGHLQLLGR